MKCNHINKNIGEDNLLKTLSGFTLADQAELGPRQAFTRFAFTLAEVLITLGIIGVVAALTMPGLVADYQKKSWDTANTVFMNRLEEATRQMNIAGELENQGTTEKFVETLQKYMKTIRVCNNASDCFADTVSGDGFPARPSSSFKTVSDFGQKWGTNLVGIVLPNGYNAMLGYNPACNIKTDIVATGTETTSCLSMLYDINGKGKPNNLGKDTNALNAAIMIDVDGLKMTAGDVTFAPLNTCDSSSPYYRAGNTYCASDTYAGAMQACADLGLRLPDSPTTSSYGYFDPSLSDWTLVGGTGTTTYHPASTSEPYKIWNWCKTNTCSSSYWLAQPHASIPNTAYLLYPHSSLGYVYATPTAPLYA